MLWKGGWMLWIVAVLQETSLRMRLSGVLPVSLLDVGSMLDVAVLWRKLLPARSCGVLLLAKVPMCHTGLLLCRQR
jgi:hypothetical protein